MDGYVISSICIAFTTVAGLTLGLRCISRFYIVRSPQIDDYLAIAAFMANLATTCLICIRKLSIAFNRQKLTRSKQKHNMDLANGLMNLTTIPSIASLLRYAGQNIFYLQIGLRADHVWGSIFGQALSPSIRVLHC